METVTKTIWEELGEKDDWRGFTKEMTRVIQDSSSPEEVKRRLVDELGYPLTDENFIFEVVGEGRGLTKMKDGRWLRYAYRWFNGSPVTPIDAGA